MSWRGLLSPDDPDRLAYQVGTLGEKVSDRSDTFRTGIFGGMKPLQECVPTVSVMILSNVGTHLATLVYAASPAIGDEIQTSGRVHQIVKRRFLPFSDSKKPELIVWVETLPTANLAP